MLSSQIKELTAAKAMVVKLEAYIANDLGRSLADLPAQYGFDDTTSFLAAVADASGTPRRRGPGRAASAKPAKAAKPAKRKRAKITAATRASVKKLAKAGKTGAAIAAELGISVPSVQNIKKALGLVRAKKSSAPKKKAAPKSSARKAPRRAKAAKAPKPAKAPAAEPTPAAATAPAA